MEPSKEFTIIERKRAKRSIQVSTAELYAALEALLPFARVEVEASADDLRNFDEPREVENEAARVQLGKEAIATAERLIARKSATIRRKQRMIDDARGGDDSRAS